MGVRLMRQAWLKHRALLLSSVLLTLLMLACAAVVGYDAAQIRQAEAREEQISRFLLNTERWQNHQQQIDIALRTFVLTGDTRQVDAIARHRQEAAEHEALMSTLLPPPRLDAVERARALLALAAAHQRDIDRIVERRQAGDAAGAQQGLLAADAAPYRQDTERLLQGVDADLQAERTRLNQSVSVNATRAIAAFGAIALLMTAVVWVSYGIARRVQSRNALLSEQLLQRATHDALTGLPNRDLFYDQLSRAIALARRNRSQLAVLYLDLDGFKAVNDSYGHQIGDATLKEAARRLLASVRAADSVARLGGDEFAVILTTLSGAADASLVAQKIIERIRAPMALYGDQTYEIGTSIGIATYPDCGIEIDRLVQAADHAMYQSKAGGKNRYTCAPSAAPERPSSTGWVSFVDDFKVGVGIIDDQHETLVAMLNRLNADLALQAPLPRLEALLEEFIAFTITHFETEERLMLRYRYPEAEQHAQDHRRLVNEFRHLQARFVEGGELLVLQWLKDWLIAHVASADRRLSEYLLRSGER